MVDSILLKNGTAILHDNYDRAIPTQTDILIQHSKITRIAPNIAEAEAATVLDCTDKLISPGFIDTHHHVWQTQLKGRHANHTLLQYMPPGNFASSFYEPDDVFWGQLAGALEMIDSGTTTVVDHAHINYSPEHSYAALSATVASGIRSVFGYCPTPRAAGWKPFSMSFDLLPEWVMDTFDKLAAAAPFANGRVLLGFAFDGLFLPKEMLQPVFKRVVDAGAHLYTVHDINGPMAHNSSGNLYKLRDMGLLDPKMRTIISHANTLRADAAPELEKYNVWISSTPTSELSMGMGKIENPVPVALSDAALAPYCSIGIDCHSMQSAFMPGQLRELLSATRVHRHDEDYKQGEWHRALSSAKPGEGFPTAEQAFNVATIGGARAVGLADSIGQIKEGYAADLVIWDGTSPSMVAAAQEDPIAAIVFHSSARDVYGVMVDGHVRKWEGKLKNVDLSGQVQPAPLDGYHLPERGTVTWSTVAKKIKVGREVINKKQEGIDWKAAEDTVRDTFHLAKETMIE